MMEFHYNVMEAQFGNRAKLLYSDTDSFVYDLEHEYIYEWIKETRIGSIYQNQKARI